MSNPSPSEGGPMQSRHQSQISAVRPPWLYFNDSSNARSADLISDAFSEELVFVLILILIRKLISFVHGMNQTAANKLIHLEVSEREQMRVLKNEVVTNLIELGIFICSTNLQMKKGQLQQKFRKHVSKFLSQIEQNKIRVKIFKIFNLSDKYFRFAIQFYSKCEDYDTCQDYIVWCYRFSTKLFEKGLSLDARDKLRHERLLEFISKCSAAFKQLQAMKVDRRKAEMDRLDAIERENLIRYNQNILHMNLLTQTCVKGPSESASDWQGSSDRSGSPIDKRVRMAPSDKEEEFRGFEKSQMKYERNLSVPPLNSGQPQIKQELLTPEVAYVDRQFSMSISKNSPMPGRRFDLEQEGFGPPEPDAKPTQGNTNRRGFAARLNLGALDHSAQTPKLGTSAKAFIIRGNVEIRMPKSDSLLTPKRTPKVPKTTSLHRILDLREESQVKESTETRSIWGDKKKSTKSHLGNKFKKKQEKLFEINKSKSKEDVEPYADLGEDSFHVKVDTGLLDFEKEKMPLVGKESRGPEKKEEKKTEEHTVKVVDLKTSDLMHISFKDSLLKPENQWPTGQESPTQQTELSYRKRAKSGLIFNSGITFQKKQTITSNYFLKGEFKREAAERGTEHGKGPPQFPRNQKAKTQTSGEEVPPKKEAPENQREAKHKIKKKKMNKDFAYKDVSKKTQTEHTNSDLSIIHSKKKISSKFRQSGSNLSIGKVSDIFKRPKNPTVTSELSIGQVQSNNHIQKKWDGNIKVNKYASLNALENKTDSNNPNSDSKIGAFFKVGGKAKKHLYFHSTSNQKISEGVFDRSRSKQDSRKLNWPSGRTVQRDNPVRKASAQKNSKKLKMPTSFKHSIQKSWLLSMSDKLVASKKGNPGSETQGESSRFVQKETKKSGFCPKRRIKNIVLQKDSFGESSKTRKAFKSKARKGPVGKMAPMKNLTVSHVVRNQRFPRMSQQLQARQCSDTDSEVHRVYSRHSLKRPIFRLSHENPQPMFQNTRVDSGQKRDKSRGFISKYRKYKKKPKQGKRGNGKLNTEKSLKKPKSQLYKKNISVKGETQIQKFKSNWVKFQPISNLANKKKRREDSTNIYQQNQGSQNPKRKINEISNAFGMRGQNRLKGFRSPVKLKKSRSKQRERKTTPKKGQPKRTLYNKTYANKFQPKPVGRTSHNWAGKDSRQGSLLRKVKAEGPVGDKFRKRLKGQSNYLKSKSTNLTKTHQVKKNLKVKQKPKKSIFKMLTECNRTKKTRVDYKRFRTEGQSWKKGAGSRNAKTRKSVFKKKCKLEASPVMMRGKLQVQLQLFSKEWTRYFKILKIEKLEAIDQSKVQEISIQNPKNREMDKLRQIEFIFDYFPWLRVEWFTDPAEAILAREYGKYEKSLVRLFPFLEFFQREGRLSMRIQVDLIESGQDWLVWVLGLNPQLMKFVFIPKNELKGYDMVQISDSRYSIGGDASQAQGRLLERVFEPESEEPEVAHETPGKGISGFLKHILKDPKARNRQRYNWERGRQAGQNPANQNHRTGSNILDALEEENHSETSQSATRKEQKREGNLASFCVNVVVDPKIFNAIFKMQKIQRKNMSKEELWESQKRGGDIQIFHRELSVKTMYFDSGRDRLLSKDEVESKMATWRSDFKAKQKRANDEIKRLFCKPSNIKSEEFDQNELASKVPRSKTDFQGDDKSVPKELHSPILEKEPKTIDSGSFPVVYQSKKSNQAGLSRVHGSTQAGTSFVRSSTSTAVDFEKFLKNEKRVKVFDLHTILDFLRLVHAVFRSSFPSERATRNAMDVLFKWTVCQKPLNVLIYFESKMFMWIFGDDRFQNLDEFPLLDIVLKKLGNESLSRVEHVQRHLAWQLMRRVSLFEKDKLKKLKMAKQPQPFIYFDPKNLSEELSGLVRKAKERLREGEQKPKDCSILACFEELPRVSGLFSMSGLGPDFSSGNRTNQKNSFTKVSKEESNQTFIFEEVRFDSIGVDGGDSAAGVKTRRHRVFMVTFFDFETYYSKDKLILVCDLESFYSQGLCRRNKMASINFSKNAIESEKLNSMNLLFKNSSIEKKLSKNSFSSLERHINVLEKQMSMKKFVPQKTFANTSLKFILTPKMDKTGIKNYLSSRKILNKGCGWSAKKLASFHDKCGLKISTDSFDALLKKNLENKNIEKLVGILVGLGITFLQIDSRILN